MIIKWINSVLYKSMLKHSFVWNKDLNLSCLTLSPKGSLTSFTSLSTQTLMFMFEILKFYSCQVSLFEIYYSPVKITKIHNSPLISSPNDPKTFQKNQSQEQVNEDRQWTWTESTDEIGREHRHYTVAYITWGKPGQT